MALPVRASSDLELGHDVGADPGRHHRQRPRPSRSVAVATKQGWLYVFDRVTGQPVWPIEERPVPQSDVPGEKTVGDPAVPAGRAADTPATSSSCPTTSSTSRRSCRQQALDLSQALQGGALAVRAGRARRRQRHPRRDRAGTATNWPGFGYDPDTAHRLHAGRQHAGRALAASRRPASSRDIRYVAGHRRTAIPRSARTRRLLRRRQPA